MITWFMALFGVLFVTATLEYTNPGDITPEEWRLIHEAETQTCSDLSLLESERRAAWDDRVTERAQLIGYSDDHLATFIASDGNCGPECIALGNVLPDDEGVPYNWEQDHGTMASSVRLHTSRFLQVNENRQVSSMGLSIGNLHVRAEEPYEDFARRMGRPVPMHAESAACVDVTTRSVLQYHVERLQGSNVQPRPTVPRWIVGNSGAGHSHRRSIA